MGNRANPTSDRACCIRHTCDDCATYYPRYLCFHADITGTGTGTGTSSDCCTEINSRLFPDGCAWSAVDLACGDGTATIDSLSVEIIGSTGTGTSCQTKVTCSDVADPIYFDGVLPPLMTFSFEKDGVGYSCEIRRADIVDNPSAYEVCAPCACATCIPKKLCLRLLINGLGTATGVATWDCESKSWLSDPISVGDVGTVSYSVSLRMATAEDNVGCVIIGSISGSDTATSFTIPLESSAAEGFNGIRCVENSRYVYRGDEPRTDVNVYTDFSSEIDLSGTGTGTGTGGIGTLFVSDRACSESCEPCRCCPQLGDLAYLTFDTPYLYGVITYQISFIDPLTGTSIWTPVPGSCLYFLDCDTVFPCAPFDPVQCVEVSGSLQCTGADNSIAVNVGGIWSGIFTCGGGEATFASGTTGVQGNCANACGQPTPPYTGTVTLSG